MRAGVRAVVEHLAALGRRRLVHIAGPAGNIDADERAAAFSDALRGSRPSLARSCSGDFEEASGERAAATACSRAAHRFDAMFAANDKMAIGALQALAARRARGPEDVAVAGFDDIPLARHLGLTTVRVRIAELGERALARLIVVDGEG